MLALPKAIADDAGRAKNPKRFGVDYIVFQNVSDVNSQGMILRIAFLSTPEPLLLLALYVPLDILIAALYNLL
jgi:hypothetical protein